MFFFLSVFSQHPLKLLKIKNADDLLEKFDLSYLFLNGQYQNDNDDLYILDKDAKIIWMNECAMTNNNLTDSMILENIGV